MTTRRYGEDEVRETLSLATTRPSRTEQTLAGLAVVGAGALMFGAMGRAVVLVVIALGASYAIWLLRGDWPMNRGVLPVYLCALLVQCLHLSEEIWRGFYRVFPPVFGADAWSELQFVVFNLIWLAVLAAAAFGIERRRQPAYILTLFLGIGGGIGNGLGHIALAVRANGYFPGLYTAPIALLAGIALLMCHRRPAERIVAAI